MGLKCLSLAPVNVRRWMDIMSSPISNNNPPTRVSQNEPSAKKATESSNSSTVDSSAIAVKTGDVTLDPSVAEALKGSDFDQAAVESIKAAIQNGEYPLDDKKIAESFVPLERLL